MKACIAPSIDIQTKYTAHIAPHAVPIFSPNMLSFSAVGNITSAVNKAWIKERSTSLDVYSFTALVLEFKLKGDFLSGQDRSGYVFVAADM